MKHHFRINGEVKEIDCELGSQKLDKNGREIFEGDIVKVPNGYINSYRNDVAVFRWSGFDLIQVEDFPDRQHCGGNDLGYEASSRLEVVGHITTHD